ncbi:hypothetical protein JKA74_17755 [Marivirga sp. S37H4]|uniref:Uncharacterized protein n=1 Tax=Marivirga aurantiaca TaxID=2802615 RepID=A0A935CDG4_9BACT|nr:hypothetical protein [Marivirga aurantiaca]MBK6266893.1 hypothetical protein [Marivirga aurantiaca]
MKLLILSLMTFIVINNYNLGITSITTHQIPNSAGRDQAFVVSGSSIPGDCRFLRWSSIPSGATLWGSVTNKTLSITWNQSAIGTTQTIEATCLCGTSRDNLEEVVVTQSYTIIP